VTDVDENVDEIHYVPIKRGDITVHNERVIHGSGPNLSNGWRRAYIVAYRKKQVLIKFNHLFSLVISVIFVLSYCGF
jgi:ectoine hydroxylase-related dioxygenase (phytanoyl-CoA dioxygenase family)